MKRKLLKQMISEWRSNIWLVAELVIVIVVVQFVFNALYNLYSLHQSPEGADYNDVYFASYNTLREGQEGYIPYDDDHTADDDLNLLLSQLRDNPYVETVATGSQFSLPYNHSYLGSAVFYPVNDTTDINYYVQIRDMSPELMQVLRIRGENGETPDELAEMIRNGRFLLSVAENPDEETDVDPHFFLKKKVNVNWSENPIGYVEAIVYGIRRDDFEPTHDGVLYAPLQGSNRVTKIAIRVKPGMGNKFMESVSERTLQVRNAYLTDLKSIDDEREECHIEINQAIRNFIICAVFILMVIFLGFLGSFWFRTQQRVPEIAIRKVNGATNGDIYIRFFGEGMAMLALAVVIAAPFTVWIMKSEITDNIEYVSKDVANIVAGAVITVIVIALLIIAGIYAPARKATSVDAAEALKDI